jgi:membrane fusion protein, heavy metal efflux system
MRLRNAVVTFTALAFASAVLVAAVLTQDTWKQWLENIRQSAHSGGHKKEEDPPKPPEDYLSISPQAHKSMRLRCGRLALTSYWRSLQIPGQVVELPGHSDRIVTSPLAGVIQRVYHAPWHTVKPGDPLFTLGIVSESVQSSQATLFKARRELETVQKQRALLTSSARTGAVPASRMLDLELQERRLDAAIKASRFELEARGFSAGEIDRAERGDFITAIDVRAPEGPIEHGGGEEEKPEQNHRSPDLYELQELKVNMGQQVQPGQSLCTLTFHHNLAIEGHAFRGEVGLLEQAAREGTTIDAEWPEQRTRGWPAYPEKLQIRTLSNLVEEDSQTVHFFIPLANQQREFQRNGRKYRVWRYRPGQRVRLHVPVEQFRNVFVVPPEAVVRDGVDQFVFRQNGEVFERKPVQVVFEDRRAVVLADDGSVDEGNVIALNNAAALNRALKTQVSGGAEEEEHH